MKVARIFQEPTGRYHVCSDEPNFLDARSPGHYNKADALREAAREGYTHAAGSGTYWEGIKAIPRRFHV